MLPYGLVCAGVVVAGGVFALTGMHPLALAVFPVPVAYFWACRTRAHAGGIVLAAALSAVVSVGAIGLALYYALYAAVGALLGVFCERRRSFGECVAAITGVVFCFTAATTLAAWEAARHAATIFINARIEGFRNAAGEQEAFQKQAIEVFRWVDTHWADLAFGMLFGGILLTATLLVALLARWLPQGQEQARPTGTFGAMRMPDWLVWVAIATAGLWFVEQQWPNDALQALTWNVALALACIYWLNGMAIFFYGLGALHAHPLVYIVVLLVVVYTAVHPAIALLGLFDTWLETRPRIDGLVARYRAQADSDGEDG